jgi:hypothetical protein
MGEPMDGRRGATRWDVVRQALDGALEGMGGATVNVWCFADEVAPAFPKAVAMGPGRRAEVAAWLGRRKPGGWTAFYDAVAAGLADPTLDTLVVLSDGAPTAGSFFTKTDVLAEIRRLNRRRRARIDVISVGTDGVGVRWRDLLERIAAESGGVCVRR